MSIRLLIMLFVATNCYGIKAFVGTTLGSGTVFCVSDTEEGISNCKTEGSGEYGLMMANIDQANLDSPNKGITWSSAYLTVGSKAQSFSDGATNTAAIIAAHPNDTSKNNAALLCHEYKDPQDPDAVWFLPAKDQLNKMYIYAKGNDLIGRNCKGSKPDGVQCLVGGSDYLAYWSSTEYADFSEFHAWCQHFSHGIQNYCGKSINRFGVRAVRVFNPLTLYPFNSLLLAIEQQKKAKEIEQKRIAAEKLKHEEELRIKEMLSSGALRSITVTLNGSSIGKGDKKQLVVMGKFKNKTESDVTNYGVWKSSNEEVAAFNDHEKPGLITALAGGVADITVTLDGITSKEEELTVVPLDGINARIDEVVTQQNIKLDGQDAKFENVEEAMKQQNMRFDEIIAQKDIEIAKQKAQSNKTTTKLLTNVLNAISKKIQ